jgi:hypothetical protein
MLSLVVISVLILLVIKNGKDDKYANIQFTDKSDGDWWRKLYTNVTYIGELRWDSGSRCDYERYQHLTEFGTTDSTMHYNGSVEMKCI